MADVAIVKVNETYIKVLVPPGIKMELSSAFTFKAPNYMFNPLYKTGRWDGSIKLLNVMSGQIYSGLLPRLLKEIELSGYTVEIDPALNSYEEFPDDYVENLMKEIETPEKYSLRDYQEKAVLSSIRLNRSVMVSSTGSGKSFMIYLLIRHHLKYGRKILVTVPTIDLVNQMNEEFTSYNGGVALDTHLITAGVKKETDSKVVITTWQSIQNMGPEYFEDYQVFFGDEAHQYNASAKKIIAIMERASKIKYRYGTTGTIDDKKLNILTLEGLFGKVLKVSKTKDLIKQGRLSEFKIKATILKYPEETCKAFRSTKKVKVTYRDEINWIISNPHRNKFLANLTKSLDGNNLLMFRMVEHGNILYEMLKDIDSHNVYLVHGQVKKEDRKDVIDAVSYESDKPSIIIASSGVFSTGINIPELDNIIFAHPTKSKRINLQAIGRVLRTAEGKDGATLYDIVDDLRHKKNVNFAYKHFMERYRTYRDEDFSLTLFEYKV